MNPRVGGDRLEPSIANSAEKQRGIAAILRVELVDLDAIVGRRDFAAWCRSLTGLRSVFAGPADAGRTIVQHKRRIRRDRIKRHLLFRKPERSAVMAQEVGALAKGILAMKDCRHKPAAVDLRRAIPRRLQLGPV